MVEEEIKTLVNAAIAEDESLFLVDVIVKGNVGNQKVLIFIDGDNGLSIDQCSLVSRAVGNEIEDQDLMEGKYTLEVSSPGLDFPISLHRQYVKNIGRNLELETIAGEKIEGELIEVTESSILVKSKSERSFLLDEIKQSKVKVSFK
ncbi:MAG: ribosome maturation factor RimP [Ekhidna sp.]|nr:ribosome maturation factor RimP [Ekhidna sp.]